MSKKTNNKYSGFFLIRYSRENIFEYTIHGNIEDVFSLYEIIQKSLVNSKISEVTSQTIKEILVNIINEIDFIDIIINEKNESVVFSIKYAGILYNPNEDENLDKNSILYDIKDSFESSYILELNNIQIKINNKKRHLKDISSTKKSQSNRRNCNIIVLDSIYINDHNIGNQI